VCRRHGIVRAIDGGMEARRLVATLRPPWLVLVLCWGGGRLAKILIPPGGANPLLEVSVRSPSKSSGSQRYDSILLDCILLYSFSFQRSACNLDGICKSAVRGLKWGADF